MCVNCRKECCGSKKGKKHTSGFDRANDGHRSYQFKMSFCNLEPHKQPTNYLLSRSEFYVFKIK